MLKALTVNRWFSRIKKTRPIFIIYIFLVLVKSFSNLSMELSNKEKLLLWISFVVNKLNVANSTFLINSLIYFRQTEKLVWSISIYNLIN